MLLSFVLRLVPAALASGDVVGQVENVETGATFTFRDVHELLAHLRAQLVSDAPTGELL